MTMGSQWHSRWRSEIHYQGQHYDQMQPPRAPVPTIGSQTSPNLAPPGYSNSTSCDGKSRDDSEHHVLGVSSMIDQYADASTYHSRLHERHNSPGRYSSFTSSSPRQNQNQPWQSLPVDHSGQIRNMTDAPLTLHIPQTQNLPKLSTTYPPNSSHPLDSQNSHVQPSTSLPSFASLSEQAGRSDDLDEVEIAPMSARLSCYSCNKLTPLLREVAIAVTELDENVRQYCNNSVTRTVDFPKDDPVRAVQWVLERLTKTKADLQDTARRVQSGSYNGQQPTLQARRPSPTSGLKRSADRWEHEELPAAKRPYPGISYDEMSRTSNIGTKEDRRGSIDFISRSPPPTESVPGSAYPKIGSPGPFSRPHRTLPSPSSIGYPPSAAPSLAPATAPSIGSPATSYQPTVSIHGVSASDAISEHTKRLQREVTVKSLAHQTLQEEYASLLQKLQREKVRSQAIEKKTSVAEQEVNELTSRNEDLTEQVKALETQLEESERKRETERLTAANEREQWTKLLALDRKLQSKNAEEKQKLREEKSMLSQRVAAYESENCSGFDQAKQGFPSPTDTGRLHPDRVGRRDAMELTPAATTAGRSGDSASKDLVGLMNEIATLNSRIDILRFSLEEAKRRSHRLGEQTRDVVNANAEMNTAIDWALKNDTAAAKTARSPVPPEPTTTSGHSTPAPRSSSWDDGNEAPTADLTSSRTLTQPPDLQRPSDSAALTTSSYLSMASIARAVSPGPAELGFHVTPSTSSPEELISALGPVPAPSPLWHFGASHMSGKRNGNGAQRKKPRKRNPVVPTTTFSAVEPTHFGSFRPLSHDVPFQHGVVSRSVELGQAPLQSFSSSPSSTAEHTSPSSSGSESRQSADEDKNAENLVRVGQSTFTIGLPAVATASEHYSTTAMGPPPRPSTNLKDLCSMPAEPITKP